MSEVFVLARLLCNFGSTLARYWLALDIRIEEILARRTREIHSFFEPIYWKMCVIFKLCLDEKIKCQLKCQCPGALYTQQNSIKHQNDNYNSFKAKCIKASNIELDIVRPWPQTP